MRFSFAKRVYIQAYYAHFTDAKLAKVLGLDGSEIRRFRKRRKLERSTEEMNWIRQHRDAMPPIYDGQVPKPAERYSLKRLDLFLMALVAATALVVYLLCLPPTVTGEDSGELITAAYTLGVPHPPGYPIWCLLTHLFTYVPYGTVAWRVALSSAVLGAMAAFFVCLTVMKLSRSRWGGMAAGLAFAFSAEAWEQFVIAEVYALNAVLIAMSVYCLVLWYESRRDSSLYAFALLYGLSLANHSTPRLLGPVFLAFVLSVDLVPWRRWKTYTNCVLLSLAGLAVYLYLPLRSRADPPIDWGNPENWSNFWAVLRQDQYTFLLREHERSVSLFLQQVRIFLGYYLEAFTPWLAVVPVLGLYALWKANRHLFGFVAGLLLCLSLVLILVLNYGVDEQAIWVNEVFFIPFFMMAAILLGLSVAWLERIRVRGITLRPVAIGLAIACIVLPIASHFEQNDKSDYWFAADYGRNILMTLEQDAILFPAADHATFPPLYLQAVEGLRPDVTIANKYGYVESSLYKDMPAVVQGRFRRVPTQGEERLIERWIIEHTDRPIYFTKKRPMTDVPGARIVDVGLLYRVVKDGESVEPWEGWEDYTWHSLDPGDAKGEYSAVAILSDFHFARGRDHLAKGQKEQGLQAFDTALSITGDDKEALNNFASAAAESGAYDAARDYFERALAVDADYELALRNLGRVYMQLKQFDLAHLTFERLLEIGEMDNNTLRLSAACLRELGQSQQAVERLEELVKLEPNDAKLYREIGMIHLNDLRDRFTAQQYFARSLQLDPNQPGLQRLLRDPRDASTGGPNAFLPQLPQIAPSIPRPPTPGLPQAPQLPGTRP